MSQRFIVLEIFQGVLLNIRYLNPNKAGLFEGSFFWGKVNLTPFKSPEEQIQCQYNFIELLRNLFKVD